MRAWLVLSIALINGCAALPEVAAPEPYFTTRDLVETAPVDRPAALPELDQAHTLTRVTDVDVCRRQACYSSTTINEPELAAFGRHGFEQLDTFVQIAGENTRMATALATAVDERKLELNSVIRIGRLTEIQSGMLVDQATFFRQQAREEWWTSRLMLGVMALGAGLSLGP